jgi:hypothetical protein
MIAYWGIENATLSKKGRRRNEDDVDKLMWSISNPSWIVDYLG